jgi:quercetin dioxygenase-like cupin family protein
LESRVTVLQAYREFADARGSMRGVVNAGQWEEINYVETSAGCTRGGPYHRSTRELFLLLSGTVKVRVREISAAESDVREHVLSAGSIFVIEPREVHWFETLTPCTWINVLSKRIDESAPDIVPVAA